MGSLLRPRSRSAQRYLDTTPYWKRCTAELIGTYALVTIGPAVVAIDTFTNGSVGIVGIAFAFSLTVMTLIYIFKNISGAHINPAVTVATLTSRSLNTRRAILYLASQLAGATLAGITLKAIFVDVEASGYLGSTLLAEGITPLIGVILEFAMTFVFVFIILIAVGGAVSQKLLGAVVGFTLFFIIIFGGPLTGASVNPARSFGPAFASNFYRDHWVFWLGPLVGGATAGIAYKRRIR